MSDLLPLQAFTPRGMMKLGLDVMQQSAKAVRLIAPWPESRLALQEFQNKLEAFEMFSHVDSLLGIPSQGEVRLPELIRTAEALGPYCAVWATEGLGYYLATKFCERREAPQNLLNGARGSEVPEKTLFPLHAGMGLAIANRFMKTVRQGSPESEIRRVLEQFVMVCRDNSMPGYIGAAYESLGLLTRNLYPQMIPKLDHELGKVGEDLAGYFWHGVGRGIYFAPTNLLLADNSERAVKMTLQEPPHELGRRNALAGLAWAKTLVNIRHPEILASFLQRHGTQSGDNSAFVNGVSSSVIVWRDSVADDHHLTAFCNYGPDSSDGTLVTRWEQMVRRPCVRALEYVYPALKAGRRLGEVFHYQSLPE
jgi:hypothetical protein